MTRRAAIAGSIALAAALIAGVVLLASLGAAPPARCARGMIALGPRCCGEGQHLEGDRCAGVPLACAPGMKALPAGCLATSSPVPLPGGVLHVGPGDWEAQGVVVPYEARIAPFAIDALEVTEQRWASCTAAGACPVLPLTGEPGRALAGVTLAEAGLFCRWARGALPTRDQLAFAAAGPGSRRYAWGDTGAVCRRAAWGLVDGPCGRGAVGPELAGSHPDGASPEGALDLAGNVAEWTLPTAPDAPASEVRGGSFQDAAATALRAWQRRLVPVESRAADVGFRCAYPALP